MRRVCLVVGLFISCSVFSDVRLGALFSDGMVIQRETLALMWGWAEPDEKVQVSTTWGAKAATKAGKDGAWQVLLKTPGAGGPFKITVTGNNTVTINDVLSGEVWLCTGQSNMAFPIRSIAGNAKDPKNQPVSDYVRHEMETATDPLLRHIEVPKKASPFEKKHDFEGQWISVSPDTNFKITATGYFFARELRRELNVPVGLVECAMGGTRIQPWISKEAYLADPAMAEYYKLDMAERKKRSDAWDPVKAKEKHQAALAKWKANGKKGRQPRMQSDPAQDKQRPGTLHNGMVSAVVPYAIKGAIWYQGESNVDYMTEHYEDCFSAMIRSWRKEWGRGDFPFYWAQLANHRDPNADPLEEDGWASICDQQRRTLKLPNTGMAVLTDIGEAKDVHPRNKPDVGKRLALWALAKDYGVKVPAYSGPLYKGTKFDGRKVFIQFSHVGSGLMVGNKNLMDDAVEVDEPLKRFQICGKDRVWKWADARIESKDTLVVSHPDIETPVVVRYAWSSNPEGANLYNKEGLPASMFTTE